MNQRGYMINPFFRNLWAVALVLAAVTLPIGCNTPAHSGSTKGADSARTVLPYEEQRRFDALFLEAVRQKERENYDAEYELLATALSLNPDAPEALYELAQLKLSFGGVADTLHRAEGDSLLHRAVELDPSNTDFKEMLANQLARQGKYPEAVALYQEMAAKNPNTTLLSILAGLQEEAGDYRGAIRSITDLENMEGKNERYSLEKFKLYNELGDNEHAYAAIEALCAEYPLDLSYRVLLGDLYQQNGYPDMALAIYRDVLTLEPDNSYAQISLLAHYKATGQDSLYQTLVKEVVLNPNTQNEAKVEAIRGYVADAINIKKDSTEVLSLFRQALRQPQENRGLAELCAYYMAGIGLPAARLEPVMEKILEVEPDYGRARLQLLDILLRKNDMNGVAKVCPAGCQYEPTQVVYYYYGGLALGQLGRDKEALDVLEKGTEHVTEESDALLVSNLYATLGDFYHEAGYHEKAYKAYEEALTHKQDNLPCLNNYAYFLSLEGIRLDDAASMSRRTVDAEPENPTFLDTYAWILYKQKQYTQARIFIEQALAHTPEEEENAGIFDHAGDIYYRCRQRVAAVKMWVKALSLTRDKALRTIIKRKVRTRRL